MMELSDLIRARIENIRPKLLDLSRRNPLISTSLSSRSNSILRVVDELPDVLAFRLSHRESMRFAPLPPLNEDPRDEQSKEFQEALSSARLTDEVYLQALDEIKSDDENSIEAERRIERDLKDRVRASLGMAPRQKKTDVSLQQHALNNNILPHYELPTPEDEHEDGRHGDENIQTLLLPEDLERRLNALMTKCRTWEQETGINVLHAAFGFLEWTEPNGSNSSYAPLILLPVKLEKRRTRGGTEFWIEADGDDSDTNFVIAEKLRREFGIDLPRFSEGSVEDYLKEIADAAPKTMKWKVRRQVAFGIFPSSRMAMYLDLDTSRHDFEKNDIISDLFGGSGVSGSTPFADEYDVDQPAIEAKAPFLVLDADSSQFSTIVDVSDGKNLAVEGPPGTGKSQTIVNAIANAIAQGKKVLFVAAKMAALEVVKARLEAVGLGEFLLPLQAERSTREQVADSIRKRLDMSCASEPRDYEARIAEFKRIRGELAGYVNTLSAPFGRTGLNVYSILGKSIATSEFIKDAPQCFQVPQVADVENYDRLKRETVRERGDILEKAWSSAEQAASYWRGLTCLHVNSITVLPIVELAQNASQAYALLGQNRQRLKAFSIEPTEYAEQLHVLLSDINALLPISSEIDCELLEKICISSNINIIKDFFSACESYISTRDDLARVVVDPTSPKSPDIIRDIFRLCKDHGIYTLETDSLSLDIASREDVLTSLKNEYNILKLFMDFFPAAKLVPIKDLIRARELVCVTDRKVLAARSEITSDQSIGTLISELCQTGRNIRAERERLRGITSTTIDLPIKELHEHIKSIRNAGAFGWMSPSYRKAKRIYKAHTRRNEFKKEDAARDFQELAEWKERQQHFANDHQAGKIFGVHFKAEDTDFDLFEQLIDFYSRVDLQFAGLLYRDIRMLLKTGDSELLSSIPDVPTTDHLGTFRELEEEIGRQESDLISRKLAYANLETLLPILVRPVRIDTSTLPALADRLERLAEQAKTLAAHQVARDILCDDFFGCDTDPGQFKAELVALSILERRNVSAPLILDLLKSSHMSELACIIEEVIQSEEIAVRSLATLAAQTGVPFMNALSGKTHEEIAQYLHAASLDREGVIANSSLAAAKSELADIGFGWVPDALEKNQRPLDNLTAVLEAIIFRAMVVRVYGIHGSTLSRFPGAKLDERRAALAKLDKEIIHLTRQHLRLQIRQEARPPAGNGRGRKSEWTEMALLGNEISKKQRFISVRELTRRAGEALLEIKPCWMMSPLAVAQYLPNDGLFDLCIIDEASQMPPEDALGALTRCRQAMVVGDTNQLPPTSFFKKMLSDEETDEDETVLDESILEMANGVFRPARRLRWHYRSRHSGLIQFCNTHVYDNDLIVFPSPSESRPDMGVSFVKIDGIYHAGINSIEASVIVNTALQFMRSTPNRSLGIVTLNQKQRDLILENMERALLNDSIASRYVSDWSNRNDGLESFFIKNLENVQGDERDVIFIGTVYGPEKIGATVHQQFGPINGLAGKRRLNVLFSRAKQQIITFSSMTAADIHAEQHTNPGVFMLKRWLEYSATGKLHVGEPTKREPDSDFEAYVIDQLRSMGCEPIPQVGVAGYRIDIGIRHQAWPHGFIMGVECDGATYHSSRSARDRDRLREEVLRNLGWKLHRIWSTDWFNDPSKEAQRLRVAIEARLHELRANKDVASVPVEALAPSGSVAAETVSKETPESCQESNVLVGDVAPSILVDLSQDDAIGVGDMVRIRYLTGEQATREVTLSETRNDPASGIVHVDTPLGRALLGAEKDEEIEILIGHRMRKVVVENVAKAKRKEASLRRNEKPFAERDEGGPGREGPHQTVPASSPSVQWLANDDLDPNRFYAPEYLAILQPVACKLIDGLGPMTFSHLSEIIARAHGFQRTGSQIKRQILAAISKVRHSADAPDGETIFWPVNEQPASRIPFRGLLIKGENRAWQDVPYPEKLGLAMEVIQLRHERDPVGMMASRIGLTRLRQTTRQELEALLAEARETAFGT